MRIDRDSRHWITKHASETKMYTWIVNESDTVVQPAAACEPPEDVLHKRSFAALLAFDPLAAEMGVTWKMTKLALEGKKARLFCTGRG